MWTFSKNTVTINDYDLNSLSSSNEFSDELGSSELIKNN